MFFLIRTQFGHRDSWAVLLFASEADGGLFGDLCDLSESALLTIEHVINFVRHQGLLPEDIARVIRFFIEGLTRVAIKERATKRHVIGGVAITSKRHVPPRHHEFKFPGTRGPENRDILVVTEAARIVFELLVITTMPFGGDDAFENLSNKMFLLSIEKLTVDLRRCDMPVVTHMGSKEPSIAILMIPVKTDRFFLTFIQRFEQHFDERFRLGV